MAHRRSDATSSDIRARVAADLRESAATFYPVLGVTHDPEGWLRDADALDAGEAVVVPGWKVATYVEGGRYPALVPAFRLEPDGSVTAMRAEHHGDTVCWVPDDGPQRWSPATGPRWETRGA